MTDILDAHIAILVRYDRTLEVTHILDMYSAILISDSDLQKSERATHKLNLCSAILVSGFYLLKKWESNSLPDWMFSHPHQLF